MAITAFILASAASILSLLAWGLAGTAMARISRQKEAIQALEQRLERMEGRG